MFFKPWTQELFYTKPWTQEEYSTFNLEHKRMCNTKPWKQEEFSTLNFEHKKNVLHETLNTRRMLYP